MQSKNTCILIAALLFAGITGPVSAADARELIRPYQVEKNIYDLCGRANTLMRSNRYREALDLLKSAARDDPSSYSAEVHADMALCYQNLKDYEKALSEGKTALGFDAACESAVYSVALSLYRLEKFDECDSYLDRYIKMTGSSGSRSRAQELKKDVDIFKNLKEADRAIKAGHDDRAVKCLQKVTAYDPSDYSAAAHASMAFALRRSGKTEKAIAEAKKALGFDPADRSTMYNLAIAYQDIARFDDAISCLNRYLSLESDPARRKAASEFLSSLNEDKKQFDSSENSRPDYFNQLKESNHARTWPSRRMPLRIFISDGDGVKGYQRAFHSYVIRSLDTWCEASGKKINYKLLDRKDGADIVVKWTSSSLDGRYNDHRMKAGLTALNYQDGSIASAVVAIRTTECFEPDKNVEAGECASVCMHEIGHSLGLGHSTWIYDVMYFRSSTKQTGHPTSRDRATIAHLYLNHPIVDFKAKEAPLPGDKPIKFLPPPTFLPPPPPDTGKLTPPLFMPPPLKKKLTPPLFTPPPLKKSKPAPERPVFIPPPPKQKKKETVKPPLFTPPPAR